EGRGRGRGRAGGVSLARLCCSQESGLRPAFLLPPVIPAKAGIQLLRSPPAKRRPRRPFPTQELTGWKGPTRTTLAGPPQLSGREALGCACRYRSVGVATARHPKPGTQSIRALPPEVAAMPRMAYVPPRPEPAGPAKVITTAVELLTRAVVPAASSFLRKQESLFPPTPP